MLKTLRDITQKVATANDLNQALSLIVTEIKVAMKTDVCSVFILRQGSLILSATDGLNQDVIGKIQIPITEGLIGLVAEKKEIINIAKAKFHPRFKLYGESGEDKFNALLAVPIIFQKQILGVIALQQIKTYQYSEIEEAFVMTLAAQLASIIHSLNLADIKNLSRANQYKGVPISRGIAIAPALVLGSEVNFNHKQTKSRHLKNELQRLNTAIQETQNILQNLSQRLSQQPKNDIASIILTLESLLNENNLAGEYAKEVKKGWSAESAICRVSQRFIEQFNQMQDPYIKERASDIKELGIRVLRQLTEPNQIRLKPKTPVILVVKEADTTLLMDFPRHKLAGIITEYSGINSHVAIVARALNIPALSNLEHIFSQGINGSQLVLDANKGQVFISPSHSILEEYKAQIATQHKLYQQFLAELSLPSATTDEQNIQLFINAGLVNDIDNSLASEAQGVGLYRTEIAYMTETGFPSEATQIANYKKIIKKAKSKSVTIRTLDIGGDKVLPYFTINESNPFLGWRGIRFSLDHPELFLIQLRAILQASNKKSQLSILFPMVSNTDELDCALGYLKQAYEEVSVTSEQKIPFPKIGVMLEVPSLIFQLEELSKKVDFISVGSNDLTQYLLAVDRNNSHVTELFNTYHPSVLRALQHILNECRRHQLDISICGELAGEPLGALLLIGMGYDKLSMNQASLARINYLIRRICYSDVQQLTTKALNQTSCSEVKGLLNHYLKINKLTALINH